MLRAKGVRNPKQGRLGGEKRERFEQIRGGSMLGRNEGRAFMGLFQHIDRYPGVVVVLQFQC